MEIPSGLQSAIFAWQDFTASDVAPIITYITFNGSMVYKYLLFTDGTACRAVVGSGWARIECYISANNEPCQGKACFRIRVPRNACGEISSSTWLEAIPRCPMEISLKAGRKYNKGSPADRGNIPVAFINQRSVLKARYSDEKP